jgi:hypothetical protein
MRLSRTALILVGLLALFGVCRAETVFLKSGSKITGKILEETDLKVRIEIEVEGGGKAVMTIDRSRIDRIETETTRADKLAAAKALLDSGDVRAAEEAYRELVRQEPKDAKARLGLAKALVGLFKYEEAIKTLEHYLLLVDRDRDTDLMLYLADQYLQNKQYKEAKDVAREAAALYPADKGLQAAADEFTKRVERVKAGIEQIKERQTAEGAERDRRVKERAEWDKEKGNNFEACAMGKAIEEWTAESNSSLVLSRFMEIDADKPDWAAYMAGGEASTLQEAVTRAELKLVVDDARWSEMYDHQKAVLIYGWYYQMKARYPKAFPSVTVFSKVKENGKEKEKKLARGSWDGRKEKVVVDRWTKENRDPGRPIRKIIK